MTDATARSVRIPLRQPGPDYEVEHGLLREASP